MILNKIIKIIEIAHFDIPLVPRVGPPFGPRLGAFWDRPRIADGPEPLPYCIPQAGEAGNPIPYRCKMKIPWISVPQSRQCPLFWKQNHGFAILQWYGMEMRAPQAGGATVARPWSAQARDAAIPIPHYCRLRIL